MTFEELKLQAFDFGVKAFKSGLNLNPDTDSSFGIFAAKNLIAEQRLLLCVLIGSLDGIKQQEIWFTVKINHESI